MESGEPRVSRTCRSCWIRLLIFSCCSGAAEAKAEMVAQSMIKVVKNRIVLASDLYCWRINALVNPILKPPEAPSGPAAPDALAPTLVGNPDGPMVDDPSALAAKPN